MLKHNMLLKYNKSLIQYYQHIKVSQKFIKDNDHVENRGQTSS